MPRAPSKNSHLNSPSPSTAVPTAISELDVGHRLLGRGETRRFESLITDNFRADVAARCYRLDRVPSSDWLLAYNFRVSSVLFSAGRFAFALLFVCIAFVVDDFVRVGGGKFTKPRLQSVHSELIAFGLLGKLFSVLVFLVLCTLIRIQMMSLVRVYVHRTEPNRICANLSKGFFSKKLAELDRSQINMVPTWLKLHDTPIEPGWGSFRAMLKRVVSFLVYADVRFGKHGARMFYTDGFRTNAVRNWVLNESDAVPKRELKLLDIGVERKDAEWRRNLRWWQRIFHLF